MVVRRRRKKNKLRGGRTQHGNTKNARGSGCRGGKGMAGGHKHRFSLCYKNFGVKIRMKPRNTGMVSLKLSEFVARIPQLLEKKLAEKKGSEIIVDCKRAGIEKIFGNGIVEHAIVLKNVKATESVQQEIEKYGGKIENEKTGQKEKPETKKEGKK